MIFTEDLKNMLHISDNDEDVDLVVKMIKRFNQQNKQLRFGNYVFGPVVMRLFHHFNKADLALEEMLDVVNIIKDKQIEGSKYPRNIVVLALAACYKMNSKESFEYALKLWKDLKDVGHFPMRRATTFCAGLALNQGQPGLAMEILTSARNQNYTTVRNLKVAALTQMGRVEDAIPILRSVLYEDTPDNNTVHTFNADVIATVKNSVTKLDNPDLALEFNRIEQLFQKQGHISDTTLDEQLCHEIQKPPIMNNRQERQQPRFNRFQNERRPNKYYSYRQRPGLGELV
ncbi:hypothetical protein NQ314_011735 [Rhamnusium bicolor]|uniref:Pentatricopeptide repeat-containing protein n=1 Tax=Rhamnusium bicolor TaxID=1586634 RepID=A0AAV8XG60_9CUCU|nr:hypothetical protein NQ314_011735 [Rhamnusium bicolor]